MTHAAHTSHDVPFSDQQMKEFQADDRAAGAVVVLLMTAIFSIGVAIYTVVAVTVAG